MKEPVPGYISLQTDLYFLLQLLQLIINHTSLSTQAHHGGLCIHKINHSVISHLNNTCIQQNTQKVHFKNSNNVADFNGISKIFLDMEFVHQIEIGSINNA